MRIEEPFVKAQFALWLASRGALVIRVSVDGAEPHPGTIQRVLSEAGYSHAHAKGSVVPWTGQYVRDGGVRIDVVSMPGVDVCAEMSDGERWVAECKGEPTAAGMRAGADRTALYTGLGQLIMTAGAMQKGPQRMLLVVPVTSRVLADQASKNPYLRGLQISVVTVDAGGIVTEV